MAPSVVIDDLASEVAIPANGIISRTLQNDDDLKVVLFGFDSGQELSEHTASVPATIHIISGHARITVGADARDASAGYWAWLPANLPHTVVANSPTVMLLHMVKASR